MINKIFLEKQIWHNIRLFINAIDRLKQKLYDHLNRCPNYFMNPVILNMTHTILADLLLVLIKCCCFYSLHWAYNCNKYFQVMLIHVDYTSLTIWMLSFGLINLKNFHIFHLSFYKVLFILSWSLISTL